MYVEYDEYLSLYGGALPFEAFSAAEPKAEAELRYLTFANGDIFAKPDQAVKLALCAAVDLVASASQEAASRQGGADAAGIRSESNDGYSVSYMSDVREGQTAAQALRRRIAEAVRVYLLPTGWLSRRLGYSCREL